MTTTFLITPNDGLPPYLFTPPEGEAPIVPEGYAVGPAPPPSTDDEIEAEHRRLFIGDGSWESPAGVVIKAERDRRIDAARWSLDAETSPLSETSRLEWVAYVKALHRITVDFVAPDDVVWPPEPPIEF